MIDMIPMAAPKTIAVVMKLLFLTAFFRSICPITKKNTAIYILFVHGDSASSSAVPVRVLVLHPQQQQPGLCSVHLLDHVDKGGEQGAGLGMVVQVRPPVKKQLPLQLAQRHRRAQSGRHADRRARVVAVVGCRVRRASTEHTHSEKTNETKETNRTFHKTTDRNQFTDVPTHSTRGFTPTPCATYQRTKKVSFTRASGTFTTTKTSSTTPTT